MFLTWIILRLFVFKSDKSAKEPLFCFNDVAINAIAGLTRYISQSLDIRDFILILSGVIMDIYFFLFYLFFLKYGKSWQPVIAIGLFYFVRGFIIQRMILFSFYDTYIFSFPGFPSFTVPYYRSADFFFSGHAGVLILIGLYLRDNKQNFFFIVSFLLAIYEGFCLMLLRAHYVIDIIFGVIAGHYFYHISCHITLLLDRILPIFQRIEKEENKESKLELNTILLDKSHTDNPNKTINNQ